VGLVTEIQNCGVGIDFGVMGWLGSVPVTGANISLCQCLQTQPPLQLVPGDFNLLNDELNPICHLLAYYELIIFSTLAG
jgi:hypothetical protein